MRHTTMAVVLAAAACATPPKGTHVKQRQSVAQIDPAERDQLFSRALSTLSSRRADLSTGLNRPVRQ